MNLAMIGKSSLNASKNKDIEIDNNNFLPLKH